MKYLITLILSAWVFTGCQTQKATNFYEDASATDPAISVSFETPQNLNAVARAALSAAEGREWTVHKVENNRVYASLRHRRYDSQIEIAYSESGLQIFSNSWVVSRSGERLRFEHPQGWLNNLEGDILRTLGLAK